MPDNSVVLDSSKPQLINYMFDQACCSASAVADPQADVFSFGIMMYEIMHQYIMLMAVSVRGTYDELEAYCARVAGGYRPPLQDKWPEAVNSIIQVGVDAILCWCRLASSVCCSSSRAMSNHVVTMHI